MPSRKLAERLISAKTKREREKILSRVPRAEDLEIAKELKNICYEVWTMKPAGTQKAALALQSLSEINPHEEIAALSFWVAGIAELTRGKLEKAIENLDKSAEIFDKIKREHEAANTQVAKLIALALLGKYEKAVKIGKQALKIFEKHGDQLAAGKIEKNLGNILYRQEDMSKSAKYYLSARNRFLKLKDIKELTMCETNLAETSARLHNFHLAEKFYAQALKNSRQAEMFFVEAEIIASMGNLAMFRGKYDDALRYLELSRQKFENLKIPHRSATSELEIADIYLELNLIEEASKIYEKVSKSLQKLKLRGEEARARANLGKVALAKNEIRKARRELKKSARLYVFEGNLSGAADVKITEANLELWNGNPKDALKIIDEAKKLLETSENMRLKLAARYLHGEILRKLERFEPAERILDETYRESVAQEQANLAQICLTSLGNLTLQIGDPRRAEQYFKKSVKMIEKLRAPLAAEEFRMAFLADKLAPFESLAKIYLSKNDFAKAFLMIERARARTLFESLNGKFLVENGKPSSKLSKKLAALREELNWFYSRLNRAETVEFESLQKEAKRRERQIAEVMRQIGSTQTVFDKTRARRRTFGENGAAFDFKHLQKQLGAEKALIEFVTFEGALSAFVITGETIDFVASLAHESEILALLEGLQFQFGALRYGQGNLDAFLPELKRRADFYLQKLYEKLIEPLEDLIGARDLAIVPAGALHYVPFPSLRSSDGKYLIESRKITYAPSTTVWQFLDEKPPRKIKDALLIGFADEKIPLVEREIERLREIFPAATVLTETKATFANYIASAPEFDVLHFACHGQFRPDNPLFSSLHLADGFVTVRDICSQKLKAEIVTLSACETGFNKIFAGDEILGLARGFLAAGAGSLVLSLWTVSDEATAVLMKDFYAQLTRGATVAAALREAQLNFIKAGAHPYFWAPFVPIGGG